MPTRLRHRHRAGHGPCRTRLLTLGLTLTAALSLSACGPAHKGQLSVEPAGAQGEGGDPGRSKGAEASAAGAVT